MSRLNPVSKRRRRRDRNYEQARRAVWDRAEGRCEFYDGDPIMRCWDRMTDVHHVAGRVGVDPHRLSNLVGLCRTHHDMAHAYPKWARQQGLMRSRLADGEGEAFDGPGAA